MTRLRQLLRVLGFACAFVLGSTVAVRAQITEPNGVVVPGVSSNAGETTLQAFFTSQGETINALMQASAEPGTFSPLCDFEAALVLKQSQAMAGIAWYNVPATPTGAPVAPTLIVPPGTALGEVISSGDIRTSPAYTGGQIGFALIRENKPVYYSEYRRNVLCTNCTTPDYWKMTLVYRSTRSENTYYLAFEDWPGADAQTWQGNDGDFNDQVFRITGVACPGGGVPCETGKPGVCAPGLTECQTGGTVVCKETIKPAVETCDGLDNDCDGNVDDGELCPTDEVCEKGRCVKKCGEVLFTCKRTEICNPAGYCVDEQCASVTCASGLFCVAGQCKSPCDGVVCPAPAVCRVGRCVDPCAGVTCEAGRVCDRGVCVLGCDCLPCATGLDCAVASGQCVDKGCAATTCAEGTVCKAGTCGDSCQNAKCPSAEKCEKGACVDACQGVSCPSGQKCLAGTCADACSELECGPGLKCIPGTDSAGQCVDACQGVDCGPGKRCQNGACGGDCVGVTCAAGETCSAGMCMNPCASVTCQPGSVCRAGTCIDRCAGVTCASGQHCDAGVCTADVVVSSGGLSGLGGGGGSVGVTTGGGGQGGRAAGSGGSAGSSASRSGQVASAGCGCRVRPRSSSGSLAWVALGLALLSWRRRRDS